MNCEHHQWFSPSLGHEMALNRYGHAGQPLVVFPTSSGRFFDFEGNGMIAAAAPFLEQGKIQIFAVDGIDWQSWDHPHASAAEKARRHNDYDRHLVDEVVPFIHHHCGSADRIMCAGVSMGASHAVLFFLRHPELFNGTIALSGLYDFSYFAGDDHGESMELYFNSPLAFLPNLTDEHLLGLYRTSRIVICVGQGAWEEPMIRDTRRMQEVLAAKGVPAWIDFWGADVNHDWPWWRIQFPYFLGHLYGH